MDERVKKFRELMDGPNELKALQRELEMHLRRYGDAEVFPNMLILKDEAYIERAFKILELPTTLFCEECGITETNPSFGQQYCRYCGTKFKNKPWIYEEESDGKR